MSQSYAPLLNEDSPENDNPDNNHKLREYPSPSFSSPWSAPSMWSWNYCGLYAQYAAVGLVYGSMSVSYNFCVYYYDGPTNLCANAKNIQMLAWRFACHHPASCSCSDLCSLVSRFYLQFSRIAIDHLDSDERSSSIAPHPSHCSSPPAVHCGGVVFSNLTAHLSFSHC
jgi:hypothetical protein